jgi:hypothetical protein
MRKLTSVRMTKLGIEKKREIAKEFGLDVPLFLWHL